MKKTLFLLLLTVPFIFQSCGDGDDIKHKAPAELTLYHGETYEINASSEHPISYSSENDFVADVTQRGVIEAITIGETTIIMDNKKVQETIKVTVPAKYSNVFPDPILNWSLEKEDIISSLGEPYSEEETEDYDAIYYLAPFANDCMIQYIYLFHKEYGIFRGVNMLILDPTSSVKNIEEFIAERYRLHEESVSEDGYSVRYYSNAYAYYSGTIKVTTIDYRDHPDGGFFYIGYGR